MTSHVTLTLDTAPPASPALSVNDGAVATGDPVVTVQARSSSPDTQEMKIWGDVDPSADERFGTDEQDSQWTLWTPEVVLRLTSGTGRKFLYARLRDDVLNTTVAFSAFVDLDLDSPVVAVTSLPTRGRISNRPPVDTSIFSWACNRPFVHYEVRVVPTVGAMHGSGVLVGTANGSQNTAGDGAFTAGQVITTTVEGRDLELASPGDTAKVVKVFVRDGDGLWSA